MRVIFRPKADLPSKQVCSKSHQTKQTLTKKKKKKSIGNCYVEKKKGSTIQGHILELCFHDDLKGKGREIKSIQADTNKQPPNVT